MRDVTKLKYLSVFITCTLGVVARAQPTACDPDPGTDMAIQYGDQIACGWRPLGDQDIFRFFAAAGDIPSVVLTTKADDVNPCIAIFEESNPTPLRQECSDTRMASVSPEVAETGTYTVVVWESNSDNNGTYSLELNCLLGTCAQQVPPTLLGYTAVTPCRIVDTRYGLGGAFSPGETRHFHVYGDVTDQNQLGGGGPDYPESCPFDRGEPSAVNINVTLVPQGPAGEGGWATVWPWGEPEPASSWINYVSGVQNIANAGTVATTASSEADPDISVKALREVHVIIDVLGYYTH